MNSLPLADDPEFARWLELTLERFAAPTPDAAGRLVGALDLETTDASDAEAATDD